MATEAAVHSDLVIPPGEYRQAVLEELGLRQVDLANRIRRGERVTGRLQREGYLRYTRHDFHIRLAWNNPAA